MNQGNNNFDTNIDLVLSMFNQYLYQDCKNNIDDIQYYYMTNPNTMGNNLIDQLLGAIKQYPLESIGLPLFQSILSRSGKTQAEMNNIMERLIEYKQYSREQIEPARGFVKDLIASVYVSRAQKLYSKSPAEFINYFKNLNFKTSNVDYINSKKFGDLDINTMIADESAGGPKSKFDWINQTFLPEASYPKAGLFCVTMPPGTGKTLFCMQECLNMALQGKRVHYLCMGDMTELDFIVRCGAQYLGIEFHEAKRNINAVYAELKKAIGDRLDITVVPASAITVDEYIDFMKDKDYDVCFIDYDSQFKSMVGTESMYLVYGDIYAKLSELTVTYKKLVFILAQPMKAAWSLPVIEMDMVNFILAMYKLQQMLEFK